jgi:hypothetical protein
MSDLHDEDLLQSAIRLKKQDRWLSRRIEEIGRDIDRLSDERQCYTCLLELAVEKLGTLLKEIKERDLRGRYHELLCGNNLMIGL